jgi:hypothetical protein
VIAFGALMGFGTLMACGAAIAFGALMAFGAEAGKTGTAFAAFSFGGLASLVTTVAVAFTAPPALASRDA